MFNKIILLNILNMYTYITKKDGFVYEVTELDSEGRHKTVTCLGKDFDYEQEENEKPKKSKKKTEE